MSTDGRRGAWSQPFRFTADDYTVLEQTNTVGSVPQLSWLPIINAVRYEVFIQHMETLTVTKMSVYTSTTSVPSVLGSGRYRVWVRSISLSGDYGLWSQPVTVDVI